MVSPNPAGHPRSDPGVPVDYLLWDWLHLSLQLFFSGPAQHWRFRDSALLSCAFRPAQCGAGSSVRCPARDGGGRCRACHSYCTGRFRASNCGLLLLQGSGASSRKAASPARPPPAGEDCLLLGAFQRSAVDYELWDFDDPGAGQQLWRTGHGSICSGCQD